MLGKSKSVSGKQAPISSHRLFPVVVAIWFAALLGVGSLVLPVAIFEKILSVTGVSSLITAAQAPLGMTARLMIAVGGAVLGAGAGVLIARKVIASQGGAIDGRDLLNGILSDDDFDDVAMRPISAHEELGPEGLDEPVKDQPLSKSAYSGKRRSLAVTDDSGPSEYLDAVPLPGGQLEYDIATESGHADHREALDLGEFEGDDDEACEGEVIEQLGRSFAEPSDDSPAASNQTTGLNFTALGDDIDAAAHIPRSFELPAPAPVQAPAQPTMEISEPAVNQSQEVASMTDDNSPSDSKAYNPFAGAQPSGVSFPRPFSQASGQVKFDTTQAPSSALENTGPVESFSALAPAAPASAAAAVDPARAPLNELRTAELVERFALALQAKAASPATAIETVLVAEQIEPEAAPMVFRRSNPATTAPEPAPEPAPQPFAPHEEVVAAPADPAIAAASETIAPPPMPAALTPLGFDDDDESDDDDYGTDFTVPSLALDYGQQALPEAASGLPNTPPPFTEELEQEVAESDSGFSSLLNMKNPITPGREFVRVEDDETGDAIEPVVVFPGQDGRHAQPAEDGPAREPFQEQPVSRSPLSGSSAPRPFDGPTMQSVPSGNQASPSAGEAERALREALEKLQRMSGAA